MMEENNDIFLAGGNASVYLARPMHKKCSATFVWGHPFSTYISLDRFSLDSSLEKQQFLNSVSTKTLTNEQYDLCKNKISETDLFDSMKSMKNNKVPGNDGLTKEFYKTFWDELKTPLMESVNQAFHTKILSISQRQAVIKLIEKKRPG